METSTLERPAWFTDEVLLEVLKEATGEDSGLTVNSVNFARAVGKGENYSSNMFRVTVEYSTGADKEPKSRRFVVKADLSDSQYSEMIEDYNMGDLEGNCYRNIIPRVHSLLESIGDKTRLAARCFKTNGKSRPKYLVFEDLKARDFSNVDRKVGLEMPHMEMVIKKLAKYHATTAKLVEMDPKIFDGNNVRPLTQEVKHFHPFFIYSMQTCGEQVSKWPGCEKYGEKLLKLVDTTIEKGCRVFDRDEETFNVLTHSDLWMNNIMFHFGEDGQPDDCLFVDFGGYHGSPALDLAYFFFTSNVDKHNEKDWDNLLRIYHEELVDVLTKLDFKKKIPSLTDLHVEILRRSHMALMLAIFVIPVRLVEDTKDADLGGYIGDEPEKVEFRRKLFSHPRYRDFLEPVLDFCYRKGLLEP